MTVALPIFDPGVVRPDFAQGPRELAAVKLLRISVTDRCNFRCVYCMPDEGVSFANHRDALSVDDIVQVAAAAVDVGVTHLKLTGGEPTMRGDLLDIVKELAGISKDRLSKPELSMTTNGYMLDKLAQPLRDAGLDRLTLSWDSMRPERFARLARGQARNGQEALDQLNRGIDAAMNAGFPSLKFNVVVVGGVNDDEVADFAALTVDQPFTVRFIEFMPLGDSTLINEAGEVDHVMDNAPDSALEGDIAGSSSGSPFTVDNQTIKDRIVAALSPSLGKLLPIDRSDEPGVGPANVFRFEKAKGRIGFISAMSQPFCEACNRLRLTSTGELCSCLFDGGEVSVLPALRDIDDPKEQRAAIVQAMSQCVSLKPDVHSAQGSVPMSRLGG